MGVMHTMAVYTELSQDGELKYEKREKAILLCKECLSPRGGPEDEPERGKQGVCVITGEVTLHCHQSDNLAILGILQSAAAGRGLMAGRPVTHQDSRAAAS